MTPIELAVLALVAFVGAVMVWSLYEMWTMPPDDPRWDIYAETETHDTLDYWWGKP